MVIHFVVQIRTSQQCEFVQNRSLCSERFINYTYEKTNKHIAVNCDDDSINGTN